MNPSHPPTPASETEPSKNPTPPSPTSPRRLLGRALGWSILGLAAALGLWTFLLVERNPRSDTGVVSAAVIGIAPRVSGPILELPVKDNQFVPRGEILFRIDPAPYLLVRAAAEANFALAMGEKENALQAIVAQEKQVLAAAAVVAQAEAAAVEATDTYERIAPLLDKRYASAESVESARNAMRVARAGVVAAQAQLEAARAAVANPAAAIAAVQAAEAALAEAQLALDDCTVRAPFDCRVAGMNLAAGAFARAGVDVFPIIDTRQWFVLASFRESELARIVPGQRAQLEIMTAPGRTFEGVVESTSFGVTALPQDPFPGLPIVMKELDWVRLSQRFPVRILVVGDPPAEALRIGATATATIFTDP